MDKQWTVASQVTVHALICLKFGAGQRPAPNFCYFTKFLNTVCSMPPLR